jgi:hypothetical protein
VLDNYFKNNIDSLNQFKKLEVLQAANKERHRLGQASMPKCRI